MMKQWNSCWLLLCSLLCIWACQQQAEQAAPSEDENMQDTTTHHKTEKAAVGELEQSLIDKGLVNLQQLDSNLLVDLRYSTTRNFVGVDVYGELTHAYMQAEPARMLAQANAYLREKHPEYTLYIYDAVRPRRVQQILWDILDYPEKEKMKYVANPQEGSIHNYGAAVDLTIAGPDGRPLDMGTDFDYFGVLAYPVREEDLLSAGRLTQAQVANRRLLREVMTKAGFSPITSEWWHFNAMSREEADRRYGIVE